MSNDVAVFLDLDNLIIGAQEANLPFDIDAIVNCIRDLTGGRIVLRRAYGDWRSNRNIPEALAVAGFELQAAVRLGTMSKNLADMQMVVDIMETLIYGHNFSTYVLLTGDRDFLPLVQALRKRGKQVIGMGLKHASSRSLVNLCDQYVYYESIVQAPAEMEQAAVATLLRRALNELVQERDTVPASLLKQQMDAVSGGAFSQSPHGRRSFRKVLEEYPEIVGLEQVETTLLVRPAESTPEKRPALVAPQPASLPEEEIRQLLAATLEQLLADQPRARASLLKQRMQSLSQGRFSETEQGADSFSRFLKRYPDLVQTFSSGSTLYITAPEAQAAQELPAVYRTALKKQGLRIMPAEIRLTVLKDLLALLQEQPAVPWRELIETLARRYQEPDQPAISKNIISDVLRIARRSAVIEVASNGSSLKAAEVHLQLGGERAFQDAVMRCDATYLKHIEASEHPFSLEAASIALYDSPARARYLKVLRNRYSNNGVISPD